MRVLIACEYSGRVREAFRRRGHDAISCDLEPAEDDSKFHVQDDVFKVLQAYPTFDLMIAHPPCTFLCNSGVRWMYKGGKKERINAEGDVNVDMQRLDNMMDAVRFFEELKLFALMRNPLMKIARENPIMHYMARARIGRPTQIIQPWWFGDEAFKGTGLWLTNLDPLEEDGALTLRHRLPAPGTDEHKRWSKVHQASPSPTRWKERSRTYQGIADAMARQWG